MKKTRMMTGMVLTAGLGLTGVVAASSSGAATPSSATSAHTAQAAAPAQPVFVTTAGKGGGKGTVCVVVKGGKPGLPSKPLPTKPLPGKPGVPGTLALPAVPGATLSGNDTTVKVVGGKLYINGKLVKGGAADTKCPLPPLPPLPGKGKGVVCVVNIEPGKGHPKPGTKTTVKVVGGKVYVNGKLVPGAKPVKDCPPLPPFPGKGGGVVVKPGKGGAGSVTFPAPGGGSLTWSEGGTTKGGSTDSTNEAGVTTSALRG